MSPLQPAGNLFSLPLIPYTAITYLEGIKWNIYSLFGCNWNKHLNRKYTNIAIVFIQTLAR